MESREETKPSEFLKKINEILITAHIDQNKGNDDALVRLVGLASERKPDKTRVEHENDMILALRRMAHGGLYVLNQPCLLAVITLVTAGAEVDAVAGVLLAMSGMKILDKTNLKALIAAGPKGVEVVTAAITLMGERGISPEVFKASVDPKVALGERAEGIIRSSGKGYHPEYKKSTDDFRARLAKIIDNVPGVTKSAPKGPGT